MESISYTPFKTLVLEKAELTNEIMFASYYKEGLMWYFCIFGVVPLRFPCIFKVLFESSIIIINYHHQLSSSTVIINYHHQLSTSTVTINHHQLSSSIINYHQLSSTIIINCHHQLSSPLIIINHHYHHYQRLLAIVSHHQLSIMIVIIIAV